MLAVRWVATTRRRREGRRRRSGRAEGITEPKQRQRGASGPGAVVKRESVVVKEGSRTSAAGGRASVAGWVSVYFRLLHARRRRLWDATLSSSKKGGWSERRSRARDGGGLAAITEQDISIPRPVPSSWRPGASEARPGAWPALRGVDLGEPWRTGAVWFDATPPPGPVDDKLQGLDGPQAIGAPIGL